MDKIICLGKNYADHAKELGDAVPNRPVIFLKPPSILRRVAEAHGSLELSLPAGEKNIEHECEVVLEIGRDGYRISPHRAKDFIRSFSIGLDMTLRDRQAKLKSDRHPWTVAKVFPDAAVVGPLLPIDQYPEVKNVEFSLWVEGQLRQSAKVSDMLCSPEEAIGYVSQYFPIFEGDLLFTGTPKGVAPVTGGQRAVLRWGPIEYTVRWTQSR